MAANVLNSPQAVSASVHVVRAFVRLRQMLSTHRELARKLVELKDRIGTQDKAIQGIMKAIHDLMDPQPDSMKERIGFHPAKRGHRPESKPTAPTGSARNDSVPARREALDRLRDSQTARRGL